MNKLSYDISAFITHFTGDIIAFLRWMYHLLDEIIIFGEVSLLDFQVTTLIIGAVITLLISRLNADNGRNEIRKEDRATNNTNKDTDTKSSSEGESNGRATPTKNNTKTK